MKKKLLFYFFLYLLSFSFFSNAMECYRSENKMNQKTADFMVCLFRVYKKLKTKYDQIEEISQWFKLQWQQDKRSLFKKKLYLKVEKKRKKAEWACYFMNETPLEKKLELRERHVCDVLSEVCSEKKRSLFQLFLMNSQSALYDVIKRLIFLNVKYALEQVNSFDLEVNPEMQAAVEKSYFLLRQFPDVRKKLFRKIFPYSVMFSKFIRGLKKLDYSFM